MIAKSKSHSVPKLPSDQAAAKLILLGCGSSSDFKNLCAGSGKFAGKERPEDVPRHPIRDYADVDNWAEFIERGMDYLQTYHTFDEVPTFSELSAICKRMQIDTKSKYRDAVKRGKLGVSAPKNPEYYYGDEFCWDKLLADRSGRWWTYDQARDHMKKYNLTNINDWRDFCRKGLRPKGIPSIPARHYDEFISWAHFLGAEDDDKDGAGE